MVKNMFNSSISLKQEPLVTVQSKPIWRAFKIIQLFFFVQSISFDLPI